MLGCGYTFRGRGQHSTHYTSHSTICMGTEDEQSTLGGRGVEASQEIGHQTNIEGWTGVC